MYLLTRPAILLRIEGAAALAIATYLFAQTSGNWALFLILLLVPDVGMLGYVRGTRLGSTAYNAFHTYAAPAALGTIGLATNTALLVTLALVWAAHIGMDRLLGFGLKYAHAPFRETHLERV